MKVIWLIYGVGLLLLWSIWRYRKAQRRVIHLLSSGGEWTGLQLVAGGVPRGAVYVILDALEQKGIIESRICEEEYVTYRRDLDAKAVRRMTQRRYRLASIVDAKVW